MSDAQPKQMLSNQSYGFSNELLMPDTLAAGGTPHFQTLTGLLGVLRRRWKTVVVTAAITLALGTIVCFIIRSYSATTIIEVNKDDPTDNDASNPNGAALTADEIKDEVQTDVSIMQNDDGLALAVIKKLDLINDPSFKKGIDSSEKGKPLDQAPRTRDNLLKTFRHHLKVDSPTDTRLVTITYKATDATLAANVTNTLANTFIDDTLERRQRSILRASSSLQHELDDLKKHVEQSEQALADYERSTGLAGIQLTGSANGNGASTVTLSPENTVTERLFGLNQELTAAEANRISTEAVYHMVQSQDPEVVLGLGTMSISNGGGSGAGSVSPEGVALVSALRAQEADLSRQYAAAAVTYGTKNPRLIQLQDQIDAVKQQMQAELGRIRQRAANDYLYAQRNESSIREQFVKQQNAADQMADKSVKLQLLAQEAFSNRALYEMLFSKLQTSALASGTRATRIDIVDRAVPAGLPSVPQWGLYLLVIAAIGVFLGVSAAFLSETLDETVRTPQDLGDIQGLTMLGYIPRLEHLGVYGEGDGSALIDSPRAPFSEAVRALRTAINLTLPPNKARTLLVTSALGSDGKTVVTYNLGVAFAQQGARVLLIDGDVRNPDLHRFFHTSVSPGLSDLCNGAASAEIGGIVQHSSLATLHLLPAGEEPQLPSELFGSPAFDSLLTRLAGAYDYVLIDSPPILAVTDASIIASKVSGIVAVVRSRSTTRPVLSGLVQAMQRTHNPSLNFVLNDVSHPTLDGFYDYSYSRAKGDQIAANA